MPVRRLVGMGRRVVGPALCGDLVGGDEHAACKQRRQRELDEGALTGAVGSGDQVEPFHGMAGALIFLPALLTARSPRGHPLGDPSTPERYGVWRLARTGTSWPAPATTPRCGCGTPTPATP